MKLRNLAVAAAATTMLALTSFAQITTIEGDVKSEDGKPVDKAQVKITRTDIKGNYDTKTNKKGHYLYMGLPMGTYNIEVYVDGKKVDGQNGVRTRPGDPIPVNFDLHAAKQDAAATQAQMQKAMETGQMTDDLKRGLSKEQIAEREKQIKDASEKNKKRNELNTAFNEGMTALQAKQYDVAVAAFEKAAVVDPNQQAIWANLGETHVKLAEGKTGPDFDAEVQKAIESYTKAIELKPDDAATHNNFALALGKAKKYPEMQAELKKAADLNPTGAGQYYYNLGAMLTNAGQYEPAGEAFKKAFELTPTYAEAYYQYGVTLSARMTTGPDGKPVAPEGMREAFQKYLELAPNGPNAPGAKAMLESLGATVETKFTDPNAEKKKKKK